MRQEFEENGYYVLRGVLTDHEVDQLARPIREAFQQGDYDTLKAGPAYQPGVHSMGPRVLAEQPQLADLSLAHPKVSPRSKNCSAKKRRARSTGRSCDLRALVSMTNRSLREAEPITTTSLGAALALM